MPAQLEFAVLRGEAEIEAARRALEARGLSAPRTAGDRLRAAFWRALRRADPGGHRRPDPVKSWDVLRAIDTIQASVGADEPVLDMGSLASAVPLALEQLGYHRVRGIDLDPRVVEMADGRPIEYVVGDLTRTPWPDAEFAAITAISVIEHGVEIEALLAEVSRLLRPGGLFLFSTDYWPEKVDTSDQRIFGLPWTIFSASEVEALVARAERQRLMPAKPIGEALRSANGRPIEFGGRSYTFLYGALVKRDPGSG